MKKLDQLMTFGAALMSALLVLSILACGGGDDDDTPPPPPESSLTDCGGIQGLICDNPDETCIFEQAQNCGRWDQMGTCQLTPELCTREYAPVCGCDDQTYSNECEALAAGVSVLSQGECVVEEEPVTACGARLGNTCTADEVCVYPPEAICGRADATGTCETRSENCTMEYEPVCGCNGQTYGNSCMANMSGASVDYEGECDPVPVY